jgi:hypothetical protein
MSNKKNLLNETQIRQFMKLASLQPLTPGFVEGLSEDKPFTAKKEKPGEDLRKGAEVRGAEGTKGKEGEGDAFVDVKQEGKDEELEEAVEELDESPGRGANEYSKPGHHRGGGVKGGGEPVPGVKESMEYRDEDEELESELHATEDELGDEDSLADEEGAELDDVDMGGETETSLTIRQVVSAIEAALEELLPNEEVDAEYVGDDDMDVEAEEEFAPEGDEVVADIEVGDEELEEALGFGKDYEKMAKGKKGSYAPSTPKEKRVAAEFAATAGTEDADAPESDAKGRMRDRRAARASGGGSVAGSPGMRFESNTDDLVEQITKRVAARILKSALAKK